MKGKRVFSHLSSRSICSCSKAVYKPVWHIPLLSVQWINSWRWTEELSETCRVSCQNKFVKLVHLVGFIIKKSIYDSFVGNACHAVNQYRGQWTTQKWNYCMFKTEVFLWMWCQKYDLAVYWWHGNSLFSGTGSCSESEEYLKTTKLKEVSDGSCYQELTARPPVVKLLVMNTIPTQTVSLWKLVQCERLFRVS
jgi:hypothetical protein